MTFTIVPYVGALPIKFGMLEEEIVAIIGEPMIRSRTAGGHKCRDYDTFTVGYSDDGKVNHIGFLPGSQVELNGVDPFHPLGFEKLLEMDGQAMELLGAVVLLNLGIALEGFDTDDESGKGIAVFVKCEYDNLRHLMVPHAS